MRGLGGRGLVLDAHGRPGAGSTGDLGDPRIPGARSLAASAIAKVPLRAGDRPRASSWGHARVWWPSGTVRDGWLRTGEGHEFTAAVAAEVTQRLLHGEGHPGAFTPGALFGSELAEAAGGTFLTGHAISPTPTKR